MRPLPHTKSCFVCGETNAIGLRLIMETDGTIVRVNFLPSPEHVGFKNTVHGGIVSTLLDELMVWACAVQTRRFAYCAELNVRFLQPLQPGQLTTATAQLSSNRRNKIFEAKGQLLHQNGRLLASSTGKYLPINDTDLSLFATDFVGNTDELFSPQAS